MKRFIPAVFAVLALGACTTLARKPAPEKLTLRQSDYARLSGWNIDAQGEALRALSGSCAKIAKLPPGKDFGAAGQAVDWQTVCGALAATPPQDDAAARVFIETYFAPYEMRGSAGAEGLFTGYYEPTLHGSLTKHDSFTVPLYGRPDDLVTVDLGVFKPELKGESIVGRVDAGGQSLVPYFDRAAIEAGAIADKGKEIVWVDNAVDAFFLHIQGSGRVVMDDGTVLRVGYAAQNGRPYTAIGKALIERGALQKDNVSMQTIRAWLEANPAEAAKVMDINTSYVFFRALEDAAALNETVAGADNTLAGDGPNNTLAGDGPLGAQGVPLTPLRSLAVDRKFVPYGAPVWLEAEAPGGGMLRRLMIAQDTGGAIRGAVRGDVFWGAGEDAAHNAGLMKSRGRAWILLPRTVVVPAPTLWEKLRGLL